MEQEYEHVHIKCNACGETDWFNSEAGVFDMERNQYRGNDECDCGNAQFTITKIE